MSDLSDSFTDVDAVELTIWLNEREGVDDDVADPLRAELDARVTVGSARIARESSNASASAAADARAFRAETDSLAC